MLISLLLGCVTISISMGVQITAVVFTLQYLTKLIADKKFSQNKTFTFDAYVISVVLVVLFVGHLVQVGIWALLFMQLGEFSNFETAFYHSTVNFASLGYGDIVMSEDWRLLGALEASNGVLMFGLSAGALLSIMSALFARHDELRIPPREEGAD